MSPHSTLISTRLANSAMLAISRPARHSFFEPVAFSLACAACVIAGFDADLLSKIIFITTLIAVSIVDLNQRIIPNRMLAPAALAGVVILVIGSGDQLPAGLVGALGAGGFLLLAAVGAPGAMGMGDVKLAAVMGLYLGPAVVPALLIALIAASAFGLAVMFKNGIKRGRKATVAFGPFLSAGALLALFIGQGIVAWYL